MPDLEHTFEKQIQHLSIRLEKLRGRDKRFSHVRLTHVLIGIPAIWACFEFAGNPAGWIVTMAVLASFVFVLHRHGRLRESIDRHGILLDLKSAHGARMRLDWDRIPKVSAMPAQPGHPFGIDLDIAGERSLHHLIDTTVSIEGSGKVLGWLMETGPELGDILKRQGLVRELSPLTLFRDKLVVNALRACEASRKRLDTKNLLWWLRENESCGSAGKALLPLSLLAGGNLLLFGLGWAIAGSVPWVFYPLFFCYLAVLCYLQIEIGKAFRAALGLEDNLNRLHAVFRHLEKFGYAHTPNLARLCSAFRDPRNRPSTQLKRISQIVAGISVRSNPMVWLMLNGILPWDVYFVRRLEKCRSEIAVLLPGWLDIFSEVEALSALANFAALHPDYAYPELTSGNAEGAAAPKENAPRDEEAGTVFPMSLDAEHLGHPLIPGEKRICNSFSLDERNRIALITGSNMSGKSSFLRTLGVGLCLAYAGAPVCAARLRTGVFRIFACMRIDDSLTDGFSFFYAEVKRLRMLLSSLESRPDPPVFFLLDEIFRGTNNRERFIGSRAYISALANYPAIGCVATHDLELVKLADENRAMSNYHFREEVEGGRMLFDYRLRRGPCPTTNALKIMAMAGLPV